MRKKTTNKSQEYFQELSNTNDYLASGKVYYFIVVKKVIIGFQFILLEFLVTM